MMISVSAITGMIAGPLGQLVAFMQQYQDAKISLERSQEVHLSQSEDNEALTALSDNEPKDIILKNVSFSYAGKDGKRVLEDISISIPAGKMTAIVGESGSGKTTLMKLLLKFYEPISGQIKLGDTNLNSITAKSLRDHTGFVMQDNFLFSDTLLRNIVMGNDIDKTLLEKSLEMACLESFVNSRPMGIYTKIGAEGIGVSGGEKQRIMIARAIYKQPKYLILDEATSNLDADNEAKITDAITFGMSDCTRIVIAHRLSTVRNADNIIVMHKGRIVEQGTHLQLCGYESYYKKLVRNQLELAES